MEKYAWLIPNRRNAFAWLTSIMMLTGLLGYQWRGEIVLLSYFLETIVIGIIHLIKLFFTAMYGKDGPTTKRKSERLMYLPFFALHYFFFVFIQSVFVFTFLSFHVKGISESFDVIPNYLFLLQKPDLLLALFSITLANVAMAFINFFVPEKYKIKNVETLMMQPYLRIFIQQFVTLAMGFMFLIFNTPVFSAILLIALRLVIDLTLLEAGNNPAFKMILVKTLAKSNQEKELNEVTQQVNSFLED